MLRAPRDFLECGVVPDEGLISSGNAGFGGAIYEQTVHDIGEAISGGTAYIPAFRHGFERRNDLLDTDIQRLDFDPGLKPCWRRHQRAQPVLQTPEIRGRIEQPVGMVDAQRIDHPGRDQFEHQLVGRFEYRLVLHAQRGQLVDIKETAIVDLVQCHTPVSEAVGLRFQQLMQQVETGGVAGLPVQ